jgi:hypothetical protein
LGWATVTHPFHPLRGQRFRILKIRRVAGREVLSLQDQQKGVFPLAREWTDQAPPSFGAAGPEAALVLEPSCLVQLAELIKILKQGVDDGH